MSGGTSRKSAARHDRVRRQHSEELAEDYVEAIDELIGEKGEARVKDLQEIFGVSHVSVIRALKRIEERGLILREVRKGYKLTGSGKRMAEESAQRHSLVVNFLKALGVSASQSEADAEGMEHHLSRETLSAMKDFLSANE
jgi:DtxR family manganese transport transcriptional regulator